MIILLILGSLLILFGLVQFIRAFIRLGQAAFYRWFANPRQVDEGYKKHVLSRDPEYKAWQEKIKKMRV